MKLLVTGAGGLLGSEFVRFGRGAGGPQAGGASLAAAPSLEVAANVAVVGLSRADLDVTDSERAAQAMGDLKPDWVVHCAAYTAVDRAEEEPEEAMRVNRGGTENVASAAARQGARLLYISTDYVFDGRKGEPYLPTDPVAPLSVYGATKLAGEEAALVAGGVVVRTGWLYGAGGGNFVDAILRRARAGESLRVVDDQRGRPTWARNVAEGVVELVAGRASGRDQGRSAGRDLTGVLHLADSGDATWLEVARAAVRLQGLDVEVEGVSSREWGAAAPRPAYSVLDLTATEAALGRPMMPWGEALERYVGIRER